MLGASCLFVSFANKKMFFFDKSCGQYVMETNATARRRPLVPAYLYFFITPHINVARPK